jgi:nitroimidazol reductase NimA-like FMN-containing flavoprotein (pyridoxamine 5'-phosphate oxidase superfamily)
MISTMRRSDREISRRAEIDEVIQGALVCHLAFAVDDEPYVVPLSYGYDGQNLYFHSAKGGKKIDCIRANPRVCFQMERDVRLVTDPHDACAWSFAFESVIGYGEVVELTGREERVVGLNHIMRHYSGKNWEFGETALSATRVWRIEIESVTGKRSLEKGT